MSTPRIRDLFALDVDRRIEEVIKVDQTDASILADEIHEYVVTDSIRRHFREILETYQLTPHKPHEGIAIWVSGFFGSGKSSFAKYLGLALEDRAVLDGRASQLLSERIGDSKATVLLETIAEKIPTDAVIFDVATERGVRSGDQKLTEIAYRQLLRALRYAEDLDLAELEIALEQEGRLAAFEATYQSTFGVPWSDAKRLPILAVQRASQVMHLLHPETWPTADSWRASAMRRADITPALLADRARLLMDRRRPGRTLVFVVDEVGQFVARDVQKMLDLQAVVQALGRVGRGRFWIVVTAQEKLTEVVSSLDDRRIEYARLKDRFPIEIHLEPSDISEVTSRRVLSKTADGDERLRALFDEHRGALSQATRITADIKLPELAKDAFAELYPLLPYQIDLIIQVVSGLRTQGGSSRHVGGANRTIIKLAQQLLIHPEVGLAEKPLGTLARVDNVYDLVAGNIGSEIRAKIADIPRHVAHPLAPAVAKAICLLQYVRSIHRTADNIAAALHPDVASPSRIAEIKAALAALEAAGKIRLGDDGYRIPTPAEDDWEERRGRIHPKPGDIRRLHVETLLELWQPQPVFTFLDTKTFKAGLVVGGQPLVDGDLSFHMVLAESAAERDERLQELRKRSQTEVRSLFWVATLDDAIDRETVELHRSKEMLSKQQAATTKDESVLIGEEKRRLADRHRPELRRLMKQALLAGSIFFRGNDRSPDDATPDVQKAAQRALGLALPEVFDRFHEAAARIQKKDLESVTTTESLTGLTQVYATLGLVKDQAGKVVFDTARAPLSEVLSRIDNRTSYGESASGKWLADDFGKEPFGWDFDAVKLFVACLLRAEKVEVTSKGKAVDSALSLDARELFANNNLFRAASFRPKVALEFTHLIDALDHYKQVFGKDIPELQQGPVSTAIRKALDEAEDALQEAHQILLSNALPGAPVLGGALEELRAIRKSSEEQAILRFNQSWKTLQEAMKRGHDVASALTEPRLHDLRRARKASGELAKVLLAEPDLADAHRAHATQLADLLVKETFFKHLPEIDQHAKALETEYARRHTQAVAERVAAYGKALDLLHATPGWDALDPTLQTEVSAELRKRADSKGTESLGLAFLRTDTQACKARLDAAIEALLQRLDGQRLVKVNAASYFSGGIDSEEALNAALEALRQHCVELLAAGRKVLFQ